MPRKKKQTEVAPKSEQDIILAAIEKMGAQVMNDIHELAAKGQLSTGLWGLDYGLGGKGIPSISVVEIHGPNGVGKTSLALHLTAQAVKQGMIPYFIDTEYAINDDMSGIFVGQKDVQWVQPESGEKALDIIKFLLKETSNSFIVLDSIGGTQPSKIADGDVADSHVGVQARMFTQFGPVAKVWTKKNNNILVAVNQESANISTGGYTLGGGRKWSYVPDLRIRLTKKYKEGDIKEGADIIGHIIEAKITKNRFGPPMRKVEIPLIYGEGFDIERELVENAILYGVVKKGGSWYTYDHGGDEIKYQGLTAFCAWLKGVPEATKAIRDTITEIVS
jgi:recombination protein RecA